jgi:hypothetical protein
MTKDNPLTSPIIMGHNWALSPKTLGSLATMYLSKIIINMIDTEK